MADSTGELGKEQIPAIVGVIDDPHVIMFRHDPLVVTGWVAGVTPVEELSVWISDRLIGIAEHNLPRPDVEQAHPEYPDAAKSGFRFIHAPLGTDAPNQIEISVNARLKDGEALWMTSSVMLFNSANEAATGIDTAFPGFARVYLLIANAFSGVNQLDECERILSEAVVRFPADFTIATTHARHASSRCDWARAIERWRIVKNGWPAEIDAFLQLAIALREARRDDEADAVFREARNRFPGSAETTLRRLGRFAEADAIRTGASRAHLEIPDTFPLRNLVTEIAPRDAMFAGNHWHYLNVGLSALSVIKRAILDTGDWLPQTVLDMPCGHGRVTRALRCEFPDCSLGVSDIDRDGVDFCARQFDAKGFYSSEDFQSLDFDMCFDLIWVGSLITHFDASQCIKFFEFVKRHLQTGGIAIVTSNGPFVAGGVRQAIGDSVSVYGLSLPAMRVMLDAYFNTGFGFANDLAGTISMCTQQWLSDRLLEMGFRIISYVHHGWDNHQDVVSFSSTATIR